MKPENKIYRLFLDHLENNKNNLILSHLSNTTKNYLLIVVKKDNKINYHSTCTNHLTEFSVADHSSMFWVRTTIFFH